MYFWIALICFIVGGIRGENATLELTEELLTLTLTAANLSKQVFFPERWKNGFDNETNRTTYFHPEFPDLFQYYTGEPDQALIAKKHGRCFLTFRGTTRQFSDWMQNFTPDNRNIFRDNDRSLGSCSARTGYANFLDRPVAREALSGIMGCIATCDDDDDCLILTGHSQGGAQALVASIIFNQNNPMLINFGQPPTLKPGCDYVPERYYRYVNSMEIRKNDIQFDMVPSAPLISLGLKHYGHGILLGDDPSAVHYMGFNENGDIRPPRFAQDLGTTCHEMGLKGQPYGYEEKVGRFVSNYPNIRTDGFGAGNICEGYAKEICQSKICANFHCSPIGGVVETCVEKSCSEDIDCAGELVCIRNACAVDDMVQAGCPCSKNAQCSNKDCGWWRKTCGETKEANIKGISSASELNVRAFITSVVMILIAIHQ